MCDRSDLRKIHADPLNVEIALEAEHLQALVMRVEAAGRLVPVSISEAATNLSRWVWDELKPRGPQVVDPLKTPGTVPLEGLEYLTPSVPKQGKAPVGEALFEL